MDNTWEYVHGRVDPGLEESMNLVESVAAREPRRLDEKEEKKKVLTEMGNGESSETGTSTEVARGKCALLLLC